MKKDLLIIGGGMGPLASNVMQNIICDLQKELIKDDTDYIPTIHISCPSYIADRSDFLDHKINKNPGKDLADLINRCYESYKDLFEKIHLIIPCNTFHHRRIMDLFLERLNSKINYINLIDVVIDLLSKEKAEQKIGILSTVQTYNYGIYSEPLQNRFELISFTEKQALQMHRIIRKDIKMGEKERGIKNTVSFIEKNMNQADIIILGCTEFGIIRNEIEMAFPSKRIIDPMMELGKEVVSATRKP